jgi:hypothetical protein
MELMERLEPEQGEFDGVFAVMRFGEKSGARDRFGGEGIDEFGRAGRRVPAA